MSGPNDQPVIIIRRKKKGGGDGHHGGAWKVAYADFVTAMMAFFLLLWLLNVTTDVQKSGIADYFTPASISRSESGASGFLGGQTITAPGAMISENSPPTIEERTIPTVGQGNDGEEDIAGKNEGGAKNGAKEGDGKSLDKDQAELKKQEEERFKQAEAQLKAAIQQSGELRDLASQLLIDQTPEGLRIQIIDKDNYSMFPSGSAILYEKSRKLLNLVGKVVARLPNNVSVTGHTDNSPFAPGSSRDNWVLSSERANVSRQELGNAGVGEARFARVVGMADREPLDKGDAASPKNRRISIVLLRQKVADAPVRNEAEGPDAPSSPVLAPSPVAPGERNLFVPDLSKLRNKP